MRDSEVKHLRRGCLSVQRDPTGRTYRRRLHSFAFKGEHDPSGVPATWVVGPPVERAIAVLERLQPSSTSYLFAPTPTRHHTTEDVFAPEPAPPPHPVLVDADASTSLTASRQPVTSSSTNRHLHLFVAWVNDYCDRYGRADRIPQAACHGTRRVSELSTSRFRRTLAWFIAHRPGGVIAGAIQFRHQHIQMFEGYAGTSASGFRDEVEAEQALSRGQFLAETALDLDRPVGAAGTTPQLSGPAAREAERRLAGYARHAIFEGQVITDERRLERVIARHDPHVYPGALVTCVYNADRALCRRPNSDSDQPLLGDCQPLACRNVALTDANRDALSARLGELESALASDTLPPYPRHRLQQRHDELAAFLGQHQPEGTTR